MSFFITSIIKLILGVLVILVLLSPFIFMFNSSKNDIKYNKLLNEQNKILQAQNKALQEQNKILTKLQSKEEK